VALEQLQTEGEIRRVPANGRLDQQRYSYTLWRPNPLAQWKLPPDETIVELARRYFSWAGPATLPEFQWFSALGAKAAKAAIEPLRLLPLPPPDDDRLMLPEDFDQFASFQVPTEPQYRVVGSIDAISLLRRNLSTIVDPADLDRMVTRERGTGQLMDLPSHAILDRGRVVGIWEYDPAGESIAWLAFIAPDRALAQAVAETEAYIRSDLGDARAFSLDSPKSRLPRLAALRKAAGA